MAWFIAHCAEMYLNGMEYNAYKHGLRVVSGAAWLAVSSALDSAGFKPILAMRHSLSYLELGESPEGYVAEEVTIELSPEYSYEHIQIAAGVLTTIRDMRIARLQGKADSLNLFSIDRDRLAWLKPFSSMSFLTSERSNEDTRDDSGANRKLNTSPSGRIYPPDLPNPRVAS